MAVSQQQVETTLYSLSDSFPVPAERREQDRHLTLFRVGAVIVEQRRELCLIKNISSGGMLIKAYFPIEVGTPLAVELKRGESIGGKVNWVREGNIGVAFDELVDVLVLLTPGADSPRPRLPRIEVDCMATLRQGATVYSVRTRDVSQGGVKVESDRIPVIGEAIIVTLPGLPAQPGLVSWAGPGCFGINFNRLMALAELVGWLHVQRELMR